MITSETIIPEIFNFIRMKAYTFLPQDRYVILAFEEFAYHKELFMKKSTVKCPPFFVVFTIQSIKKQLYQPVACVLWDRTKLPTMANLIRVIIHALYLAGLTVVATVCNHHFVMYGVVKYLFQTPPSSPEALIYSVGPEVQNIVHIFDAKSLLKDVHRKLCHKSFQFTVNEKTYFTSPNILQLVYLKNASNDASTGTYFIDSLSLSQDVNEIFLNLSDHIKRAVEKGELKKSAIGTSLFCTLFNGLCDSFTSWEEDVEVLFKRPVLRQNANHFALWAYAEGILKSMYLRRIDNDDTINNDELETGEEHNSEIDKDPKFTNIERKLNSKSKVEIKGQLVQPCCINLWLCNVMGMTKLVKRLHEKRFKAVPTKNFSIQPILKFVRETLPSNKFDISHDEFNEMKAIDHEMAKKVFKCNNVLIFD